LFRGENVKELTAWKWAFIEKPPLGQLLKKFPAGWGEKRNMCDVLLT
jgi:hypothetical protein